jgi:hypothetical protein
MNSGLLSFDKLLFAGAVIAFLVFGVDYQPKPMPSCSEIQERVSQGHVMPIPTLDWCGLQ